MASNLSDGLYAVAAPLLAASLTRDPVQISILGAMSMVPWLLFAIPIGGLTDRVNRRLLLIAADFTRTALGIAVVALILNDVISIYWVYLLTFLFGVAEVTADTAAQSMIPQLLKEDELETGNSRLNIAETVIQNFIGVPIGGLLWASAIALPFIVGTTGFAIAALVLVLIPKRSLAHWNIAPVPREKDSRFIDELKFGITYLFNDDKLRSLVIITTSIGFFYSASASTFVLYVLDVQKIPEASFGVVMTIVGLGSLAGATLAPKLSTRFGRGNVMAAALLLESSLIVVQGLAPHVALFVSSAVIASACITIWNILLMSTYQVLIPSELYGRIHGARRTLVWGLMPFGSLAGGFVAQFGLRVQMVSFGLAATVLSLFVLTFVRRIGDFSAQKATLA